MTAGEIILDTCSQMSNNETNSNNERQQPMNNYGETRGTLHYMVGMEVRTMTGHFTLSHDRRSVIGRSVRGRNRWQVCTTDAVVSFDAIADNAAAVK